jgi:hypothetical protein
LTHTASVVRVTSRRTIRPILFAAAALFGTTGCATFTDANDVIRVGDGDLVDTVEQGDFDALLTEFVARPDVFGTTPANNGVADADQARYLMSAMVRASAIDVLLATAGTAIDDDDRAPVLDVLESDHPWRSLSSEFLDLVVDSQTDVVRSAFDRVDPATPEQLEELYADHPAMTGLMCVRHILVDTRDEAAAVIERLHAGEEVAAVAVEVSTEPAAVDTGGALGTADNACIPVSQYNAGFDPGFTRGAYATPTAAISPPVESSFGWHVIVHRPWDEVGDDVVAAHIGTDSAVLRVDGLLAAGNIEIDPRYGTWDAAESSVIPVG